MKIWELIETTRLHLRLLPITRLDPVSPVSKRIGISEFEDKENMNYFVSPREFHKLYNSRKLQNKKIKQASQSDRYLRNDQDEESSSQTLFDDQNPDEDVSKTQNTQDYRKKEDFVSAELDFDFSEEKPTNNFTRFEIKDKELAEMEKVEESNVASLVISKTKPNNSSR